MSARLAWLVLLAGVALGAHAAHPARAPFDVVQLSQLAKGLERELAQRRARVAIIARLGRPSSELPTGIDFTHAAYAVYAKILTADNRTIPGYAVFNLYQGAERPDTSTLAQDYPLDYFAAIHELKTGVIIPSEKLQTALARTIFSDSYRKLHNPRYSVLANPFNPKFQNCTEFVLDVLFASIYGTDDIRAIKTNIAAYYQPQPVHIDGFKLMLGKLSMPDLKTSDHDGPIATSTFSSIARFLNRYGMAQEVFVYRVEPTTLYGYTEPMSMPAASAYAANDP